MAGITRKRPTSFHDTEPSRKWWSLLKKRHPSLTFTTPKALSTARKNISTHVIKQWSRDLITYFFEDGVLEILSDPSRLFNIDESGVVLSPKHGKVLAEKRDKVVFEEAGLHHKTNITVLGNVCAKREIKFRPPMIIYPRKRIHPTIAEEFPEGFNFTVGRSEKGYITYETMYRFLYNGFDTWLTNEEVTLPVIVFTDCHETLNN